MKTAKEVLEWAQMLSDVVDEGHGYLTTSSLQFTPDTATAERIALALAVLEIVEMYDGTALLWPERILAEAKAKLAEAHAKIIRSRLVCTC